ncbi:glutathione synthetase ATP-binding protein [Bacillus methanolicus PB1]|uniref:Glutathione synthetase ATP-binding protein n=1 Tax=Bacillus methanolicus PB1 TaxID=997296 RepID=I3E657_BACMT|nr:YheC/YheD family protein [Bacillus methanolicus]EIJ81978.1 glutathione synthetase ATP-binding protein [Bacillus methanolicus PB1]
MTFTIYSITVKPSTTIQNEDDFIYANKKLLQKLGIKNKTFLNLCFGRKSVNVKAIESDCPPNELFLPEGLMKKIMLPKGTFCIHYSPKNFTIILGPVIALLTEISENDDGYPDFRSVHAFCEEIHHGLSEIGGLFYVFTLRDFSKESITGYCYEDDCWTKRILPLPDVIYNRIHSRRLEYGELFQQLYRYVQEQNISFFNYRFLSKWEVHSMLLLEEHMHPYLPQTSLYSRENLEEMLEEHHSVFLKPVHGSQGRNIIRLSKYNNEFCLRTSAETSENSTSLPSLTHLFKILEKQTKRRLYLIQQEIPLITYDGRKLDFRILCHKNKQESWIVTSSVARISALQQFVSNIARGGEMIKPLKALANCFDRAVALQIFALMKEIAVECAAIIEQQSDGATGELGIDMGVDPSGHIWIIEVNSKPSKKFEEPGKKIRPSAKAIVAYSTALAFKYLQIKEEKS